jgi:predicted membrane metal-binding protein
MALLSELVIITRASPIITDPLIVYHFGRLLLISLLTNLLILPVQPPIMIWGGLATLAGMVGLPMGQMLDWHCLWTGEHREASGALRLPLLCPDFPKIWTHPRKITTRRTGAQVPTSLQNCPTTLLTQRK